MPAPTVSVPTTGADPKGANLGDLEAVIDAALEVNHDNIEDHKSDEASPHGATSAGMAVLKAADAPAQRAELGLGSAALSGDADFASAAQGVLADSAAQSDAVAEVAQGGGVQAAFHYGDGAPDIAITDDDDAAMFMLDATGRQMQRYDGAFHYGDGEPEVTYVDGNDLPLQKFNADGTPLQPHTTNFAGGDPIRTGLDITDENDRALLRFNDGGGLEPGVAPPPMPRVTGGMVYAENEALVSLGSFTASSLAPFSKIAVRALIDRRGLGTHTGVLCAPNLIIPDQRPILSCFPVIGQSLGVGANSYQTLLSTVPTWAEDALMLKTRYGGHSDVRMGVVDTSGVQPGVLDTDALTDFTALKAVAAPSGNRGQSIAESFATALAQTAREHGITYRTLSINIAHGGMIYDNLKQGMQVYNNGLAAITRAKALAEAKGWRLVVPAMMMKHGESDAASATYGADIQEWQSDWDTDIKAVTGQEADVHFLMSQPASGRYFDSVQAMLDVHNSSDYHHLCGPDYAFLDAFDTDYLHFLGPGYYWIGEMFARAAKQVLWTAAEASEITQITAMSVVSSTVTLTYEVPVGTLVLDTDLLPSISQSGFRYFDSSGEATITNVSVTASDIVELSLDRVSSGSGEYVTYAQTAQGTPRTAAEVPRGNLRDSNTDVSTYQRRALPNWAVPQKFTA